MEKPTSLSEEPNPDLDAEDAATPTIGKRLAMSLTKPLVLLGAQAGSSSMELATFPQRFVTTCRFDWGSSVSTESTQAIHQTVIQTTKWCCTSCGAMNPRHWLACDECSAMRKTISANALLDSKPYERYRYALLRSKEASHLRTKLNNKLRSLLQAQLDDIQNAMQSGSAGGSSALDDETLMSAL